MAAARKLLSAGGYVNNGLALRFVSVQGANFGGYAGLLLQNALKEFGIALETQALPWPQPATAMANPNTAFDISFLNISANTNDPTGILATAYSSANVASKGGYNWANYQNPNVDALIKKARAANTPRQISSAVYRAVNTITAAHLAIYAIAPQNCNMVTKAWPTTKFDSLYNLQVLRFFYTRKAS
jgi:ABC-type transport system substrate-binding protein